MIKSIIAFLAVFVALAASVEPSNAQERRFCTQRPMSSWGWPDCGYDTFEQCRASASGTGAYCISNPNFVEPKRPAKGKKKRVRQ